MNIDILHRPTALENLLAGRMRSLGGPDKKPWRAGFGPRAVGCPCMVYN